MTRINCINTDQLSDQLLLNELGEVTRIFSSVLYRIENNKDFNDIPETFTLGSGHMKFFFPRCGFILNRYMMLRNEYERRTGKKYSLEHLNTTTERYLKISRTRKDLCFGWTITPEARESVLNRILERSKGYSKHTYCGQEITNWKKFLYENNNRNAIPDTITHI